MYGVRSHTLKVIKNKKITRTIRKIIEEEEETTTEAR